jgi:hypothetical protein
MTGETAREISTNSEVLKRLAKYLAQQCFRNTILDDLHAGITPDSQIGDYTDVVVRSPYGEIPWPNLSRLNDEEMKALMIRCCEQDVPDRPVRRPARRRTDQDLSSARFVTSLERTDLDHDGLRPDEPLTA